MTKEQIDFMDRNLSSGEEEGVPFVAIPNMDDHEFTTDEIFEYLKSRIESKESND